MKHHLNSVKLLSGLDQLHAVLHSHHLGHLREDFESQLHPIPVRCMHVQEHLPRKFLHTRLLAVFLHYQLEQLVLLEEKSELGRRKEGPLFNQILGCDPQWLVCLHLSRV